MAYINFNSDGYAVSFSSSPQEGFIESSFAHLNQFRDSDGNIRELTADEIITRDRVLSSDLVSIRTRDMRNLKLQESDWVVTKALESGGAVAADWVTYRQALRDLPEHANWPFLEDADWPTSP